MGKDNWFQAQQAFPPPLLLGRRSGGGRVPSPLQTVLPH